MTTTTFGRGRGDAGSGPLGWAGSTANRLAHRPPDPTSRRRAHGTRHPVDTGDRMGCVRMSVAHSLGDTMFERLFGGRETDPAIADRIPPGQYKTEKFPVLHYGSVPHTDLATWDFKVFGEVDNPFTLTWDEFKKLPRKTVHTDIHCVTRWTKLDTDWEGVAIQE